ncbi:MAG: hypothetical protein NT178_13650 [Proteobacteria bacterium]|nr:hypothetical protein [Pseudomonadota bacterium]
MLILSGKAEKSTPDKGSMAFKEFYIDYTKLPQLKTFTAREGKQLAYRYYSA